MKKDGANFSLEGELWHNGLCRVAGVDEAGRGSLAGPIIVAATIFEPYAQLNFKLADSKELTPQQREAVFPLICKTALSWTAYSVSVADLEQNNVLQATLEGMNKVMQRINPDYALIDGNRIPQRAPVSARPIIKGDKISCSIAAASILAKVIRDRIMCVYGRRYPDWNFAQHKGYGTVDHVRRIKIYGQSAIHRRNFKPKALHEHLKVGQKGEEIAREYLSQKGYRILDYDVRSRYGQIDIIAQYEDYLVIAEVKTHTKNEQLIKAEVSVNQRQRLITAGENYRIRSDLTHLQPRFDVLRIELEPLHITHYENAF